MNNPGIRLLSVIAAVVLHSGAASPSLAENYPARPIRLVVGQEAGSALDNGVRIITPGLAQALQQQIVIDNRPGVGGMIAMQIGVASVADGYTLVNAGSPQMIAPFLFKKLDYDIFTDFVPIGRLTIVQNALVVNTAIPVSNIKAFIELLKSRPGNFNMASAGIGSASHLAGVLFNTMTGISAVHVPYKGGAAAVTAIIGNEVQYMVTPLSATISNIKAGRLKVLAVGGEERTRQMPEIPTMEESGIKGYRSTGWNGIFAPKGIPQAVTARLTAALRSTYESPALPEQILRAGVEPGLLTGASFTTFMREDMARFGAAAKAANLRAE